MKSIRKKTISIKKTLMIYSLAVAVLPILIVGIIALYVLMANMKQDISNNNLLLSRSLAGEVDAFLIQPLNLLKQIKKIIEQPELVRPDQQNIYLESLIKNYPFMVQLMVISSEGRVTAIAPYSPNLDAIDMSGKKFFRETLTRQKIYWSPTFIPPNAGEPTISVSIPYENGMIAGYLNLSSLNQIIDKYNKSTERAAMIVDNEGTVIAHPDRNLVTQRWNLSHFGNIEQGLAGKESTHTYELGGKDHLGSVAVVPGVHWVVHISQPLDIAYAPIRRIGTITVVGMLLAMLAAIVISFPVMRKILAPLLQLTRRSGHIAQGDYRAVDFRSAFREIDELSRSFDLMVTAIRKREEKLRESEAEILKHTGMLEDANRELQAAKEVAEAANRAKTTFLSNMSHELRTPLNAILGFTQLMRRDASLPVAIQKEVGIVSRCGQHLLSLINDVLEIAKIEAGRIVLNPTRFDLHWFLQGIKEIFASTTSAQELQFISYVDPNLIRRIRTDESKLRQILINLLGNATKFTSTGWIALRVTDKNVEGRIFVCFEIEDTGIGMSPEDIDTIFKPFVQVGPGSPEGDNPSGTGLGLAISRQYVELMGGDISVSSKPGEGTVFSVEIPVEPVSGEDVAVRYSKRCVIALAPDQPVYRILIVEDQEENRDLLKRLLDLTGFEVREAANGREGVEIFFDWLPDLVWMDIRMPVMDGYEATRRIRAGERLPRTPVIALTAHAFEEERDRILAAGCNDIVGKPFLIDELYDAMARHLGVRYLYKEDEAFSLPQLSVAGHQSSEAVPSLPEDIVLALKDAIVAIDTDMISKYIGEIKDIESSLGNSLSRLADEFQFDRILAIIDPGAVT